MTLSQAKKQRDCAVALFIFSISITAAVFCNVMGARDRIEIAAAKEAVALHTRILAENNRVLEQTHAAQRSEETALLLVEQSKAHSR